MEYERYDREVASGQGIDRTQAIWIALFMLAVFISPLMYDLWSLLGGV